MKRDWQVIGFNRFVKLECFKCRVNVDLCSGRWLGCNMPWCL